MDIEGLEKAEKGQGLALKLCGLGRVKYQQHVKHTHRGIGILPSLLVKYWTNGFYKCKSPISCIPVGVRLTCGQSLRFCRQIVKYRTIYLQRLLDRTYKVRLDLKVSPNLKC